MDREGNVDALMGETDPVMKYCEMYDCTRIEGKNEELTAEAPRWDQNRLESLWAFVMDNPEKWETLTLEEPVKGVVFEGRPWDLPKSIADLTEEDEGLFEILPEEERKVASTPSIPSTPSTPSTHTPHKITLAEEILTGVKIIGDRLVARADNQKMLDAVWKFASENMSELNTFSLVSGDRVLKGDIWELPIRLAGQRN